jgi:outer membrane receptor protein involved in Fe transport
MTALPTLLVLLALALPPVAVSGRVRTFDDGPVPGATVIVRQGDRVLTAMTNERGEFDIPDATLPASVEVRAAGFRTVREQVTASPAAITLTPSPIRESVLVSAGSSADTWRHPATGTTVLSSAAMDAIPSLTLDEILRVISGFSLFRRSSSRASNPTTHGVTMRGLSASGASRGLVLLDGIPLTEGFGSWVTWSRIPALALGTVEIDRGAHGSTFGSDALGGVLTLLSRNVQGNAATVSAMGGNHGISAVDVAGGGPRGDSRLFGAMSWFRTDGTVPTAPESAGTVDVRTDTSWLNGFGKAQFGSIVDRLTMTVWASRDERGNGTPLQRNRMAGGTIALSYDRLLDGTTIGARVSLSPNAFTQSFSTVAASRQSETLTSTQFTDTTATRIAAEAGRVIRNGYVTARFSSARTGAEFTERRTSSAIVMALRDDSDSVSAHAGWSPAASVSIGAGLRREWREAPRSGAGRDAATVGHASGSWRLTDRLVLRGAASSSHRWPTLNEQVRNFQVGAVLTRANANLLPERARSAEGALAISGRKWNASAGGFWSVVRDAIANVTIQTAPSIIRERRNAGEARARGMELDGEIRLDPRVTIRGSALIVNSRFRRSLEPALEGNWLPQVPRVSGSIGGDVRPTSWSLASFVWRSSSSQFDDDRNVFTIAKAGQLDLRIAVTRAAVSADLTVENVTDERIEVGRTPLVTIAPSRTVRVGLTWRIR